MSYDNLLIESAKEGLIVKEAPLTSADGRLAGNRIAIRQDIDTTTEKACILAEEIGHYHTNTMNILDQEQVVNRKLERAGRLWAYDRLVGLSGIIHGHRAGCRSSYELAELLGVTEDFLQEALTHYRKKYGIMTQIDRYTIIFEPSLMVIEKIK